MSESPTASRSNTGNIGAFAFVRVAPLAHARVYRDWLYSHLSRSPYLRKPLVREAISESLAAPLSEALDVIAAERYLAGWKAGYEAGLRTYQ